MEVGYRRTVNPDRQLEMVLTFSAAVSRSMTASPRTAPTLLDRASSNWSLGKSPAPCRASQLPAVPKDWKKHLPSVLALHRMPSGIAAARSAVLDRRRAATDGSLQFPVDTSETDVGPRTSDVGRRSAEAANGMAPVPAAGGGGRDGGARGEFFFEVAEHEVAALGREAEGREALGKPRGRGRHFVSRRRSRPSAMAVKAR